MCVLAGGGSVVRRLEEKHVWRGSARMVGLRSSPSSVEGRRTLRESQCGLDPCQLKCNALENGNRIVWTRTAAQSWRGVGEGRSRQLQLGVFAHASEQVFGTPTLDSPSLWRHRRKHTIRLRCPNCQCPKKSVARRCQLHKPLVANWPQRPSLSYRYRYISSSGSLRTRTSKCWTNQLGSSTPLPPLPSSP